MRLYLPKHNASKDYTVQALKTTIESLKEEGFKVKIWISIPRYPWRSWQRMNLKRIPNFEERLKKRKESLI